ncbi:hypothetical protein [Mycetocola reblochoni]|uniref:Uncharacterized protein n=1 Tax=Mycetocola reblochoni REB411 TaxID=1255698 RepID=A0A1R4JPQ1_9MICO|nr:hypothetical protein [Mycetocola reblochoni]SJN34251.1 hypothetical protein FM119_08870 [Mycetocola reblochoni REB411]
MRVEVTVAPSGIREITVEADNYEAAKELAEAQIPDGWRPLQWMVERD